MAGWGTLCFPLLIASLGILVCFLCSFLATNVFPVRIESSIELALRTQLVATTVIMIPATYYLALYTLPAEFVVIGVSHTREVTSFGAFICVTIGTLGGIQLLLLLPLEPMQFFLLLFSTFYFLLSSTACDLGLMNGLSTEYYTSKDYSPVRELAESVR